MNVTKPIDPYSPAWPAYWAANPHLARGVGAEAAAVAAEPAAAAAPPPAAAAPAPTAAAAPSTAAPAVADAAPKTTASDDWTADLPDDLKETGKRFTSKADAVRAIIDFRKRDSQIRVPGKDAKPEDIAAYHKAIGVPDKAEAYEFHDVQGVEVTDAMKAERAEWGKRFQSLGINKDAAKKLSQFVTEDNQRLQAAVVEADKKFAQDQEAALRNEWKGDEFDRNKTLANNAFRQIAAKVGVNVDDMLKVETKDGRFLLDRADMLRVFAAIGREMSEGSLGPTLTDSEKDSLDEQIRNVRSQQQEAQSSGDSKRANKLYQQEQALIAKKGGSQPVVGARGRMV